MTERCGTGKRRWSRGTVALVVAAAATTVATGAWAAWPAPAGASPPAAAPAPEAAAHAGHGGVRHVEESVNWFDFTNRKTPPIVALVVNFALLLWLLIHFGRRPAASFLADRKEVLLRDIDEAREAIARAEGRAQGFKIRAAKLDEELMQLRADLLRIGHDERDRVVADAGARAEKIRREAEFGAAEESRRARHEVKAKVVEAAIAEAERTLRGELGPQDQTRLAEAFLAQIGGTGPR